MLLVIKVVSSETDNRLTKFTIEAYDLSLQKRLIKTMFQILIREVIARIYKIKL